MSFGCGDPGCSWPFLAVVCLFLFAFVYVTFG